MEIWRYGGKLYVKREIPTEQGRFELPCPFGRPVFKTGAL